MSDKAARADAYDVAAAARAVADRTIAALEAEIARLTAQNTALTEIVAEARSVPGLVALDAEIAALRGENASLRYDAALPIIEYAGLPLLHLDIPDFLKRGEKT